MIGQDEMILRLILSAILGGLIGLEREASNRPAGLRTHILVAVGSTLIMLVSMYGFINGDPARLAAQVVSGIGFLGAGTILRQGKDIRGLTTAASLWVSGGIGLAIGNGSYLLGVSTGILVLFSLISLGFFEKQIFISKYRYLQLTCVERIGLLADIGVVIANSQTTIKDIKIIPKEQYDEVMNELIIDLTLATPEKLSLKILDSELLQIPGIKHTIWKNTKDMYEEVI